MIETFTQADIEALKNYRPRDDDELFQWVRLILNVRIPRVACCPGHSSPFEAFAHAYFAKSPECVWYASRGLGGKSFLLACLALTEQITLAASITILGGSGEQSDVVYEYLNQDNQDVRGMMWDSPNAPRHLRQSTDTKQQSDLTNGGRIRVLTASQKSVRGKHPARLRMDEVDEMDLKVFTAAHAQPMEKGGIKENTVMSSTWHNPKGTMTEVMKLATEKGWPVFEWCYKESMEPHGWLSEGQIERKRKNTPSAQWAIEFDLQEPSPENRAINPEAVEAYFNIRLGKWLGEENREIIHIHPGQATFYHGADWAKTSDWTIMVSFMERLEQPDILSAWLRTGRLPWSLMVGYYNARVLRYGGRAAHDGTQPVGGQVADELIVPSHPIDMSQTKLRAEIFMRYINAIETGQVESPFIQFAYGEHKYATWADLFTPSKHAPDSFVAGACAWHAKSRANVRAIGGSLQAPPREFEKRPEYQLGRGKSHGDRNQFDQQDREFKRMWPRLLGPEDRYR